MTQPIIYAACIVKDEENNLPRMLSSVKDRVDGLIAVDTGSTDNTIALLDEAIEELGGEYINTEFKDFAHSRNMYLELAKSLNEKGNGPDWILVIDADRELVVDDVLCRTNDLATLIEKENPSVINIPIKCGDTEFYNSMLIRVKGDGYPTVRYILPTHECLEPINPEKHAVSTFDGISLIEHGTGSSRAVKYERDERLLLDFITNALYDTAWTTGREWALARAYYYLGQTYHEDNKPLEAYAAYASASATSKWPAEVSWIAYKISTLPWIPPSLKCEHLENALHTNPTPEVIYSIIKLYLSMGYTNSAKEVYNNRHKLISISDDGFKDMVVRTALETEFADTLTE